jgi:hypothetical protein
VCSNKYTEIGVSVPPTLANLGALVTWLLLFPNLRRTTQHSFQGLPAVPNTNSRELAKERQREREAAARTPEVMKANKSEPDSHLLC